MKSKGYLKVTTSRGNVYALEDGKVKAAGAKLNGSITAETKLFASQPEDMVEFSYDHNGLRTQKKVTRADGIVETTDYILHGKLITHLTKGEDAMHFFYDAQSRPAMVEFNGTLYSYAHNLQGDIVGILDSSGNVVVEYGYDAWGKPVVVRTLTTTYEALAELNPFRYRGYVWDEETELYYLRSRYYDSRRNRFINSDDESILLEEQDHLNQHNLISYCLGDPINNVDDDGYLSLALFGGAAIANSWNPLGWLLVAAVAVAVVVSLAKTIDPDPYARPGQKKQGRERKSKARKKDDWKPRSNPRPLKKHTPGRNHRKYGIVANEYKNNVKKTVK